ncbi:MAG: mechanosensitive ion channel domain-containing protein [Pseudomonadota bacterium]
MALFLLALLMPGLLWSESTTESGQVSDIVASRQKLLDEGAADLAKQEQEVTAWRVQEPNRSADLLTRTLTQIEVEQVQLAVETRKVALESIDLDIAAAAQTRKELSIAIQLLKDQIQVLTAASESSGDKELLTKTEEVLAEKQQLLELEQKQAEQHARRKELAQERLALAEQWLRELNETFQGQQEKARQQSLEELEQELNAEQSSWQNKAIDLRSQLTQLRENPATHLARLDLLGMKLLEAEESIFLLGNRLKWAHARAQLEKITTDTVEFPLELRALKKKVTELEKMRNQLSSLGGLLNSKRTLLQQRQEVIDKRSLIDNEHQQEYRQAQTIFLQLFKRLTEQADDISRLSDRVGEHVAETESSYLEQKKEGLTERHRVPRSVSEWQPLLDELMSMPGIAAQIGRNTLFAFWTAMQQAELGTWTLLLPLELLWIAVCLGLGRLSKIKPSDADYNFAHKATLVGKALLRDNRFSLLIGGLLINAGWLLDIVPPGLVVMGALVGAWLGARVTIGLSRWVLNSPVGLPARQPGLHRLIVIYSIVVALASLDFTMAHLGFLSTSLRDLFDRLFMVLLLPPAYLTLRIRTLLMEMFSKSGSVYWVRLLGLAGLVVPLAIMSATVLGIVGYVNLAWYVAGYLVLLIGIMAGWSIVRGLVMDLANTVEVTLKQRSKHSAFWVKSLVEPIHFLIRLLLFLLVVYLLYRLFVGDPTTGIDIKGWLGQPLFSIGKTSVNSRGLLGSLLLIVLVFYIGRWVREITFSWLYGNIRDLGLRNSLSVFTQYAVVVIGLLVAMNIIGIDLTSLTVFAGALGVGIGFGLQNIANNLISGIILLAERPVRSKDWVTIGDKEGEVSEIGMRSVTLTTWDNQDVIIPNADLVSNAFINWTRSNSVVRTVLFIGVHYQDDPHQAQAVIEEAVTMQPEVSLDPPPHIWLHEFGASSVDFRIHYYLDVRQFSRLEVKSKVLFAIWDGLKEAGISIPYPQQDVYIKEMPGRGMPPRPDDLLTNE